MATSGTVYSNYAKDSRLYVKWSLKSQDAANNTSTISWEAGIVVAGYDLWYNNAVKITSVKIDGSVVSNGGTYSNLTSDGTYKKLSGTKTISHNADGSKSITVSIEGWFYDLGNKSGSGTYSLTSIPRKATLTAAPNFNDENNPTISYSNPAGNSATSLQACIASTDGGTIYVPYRDISKTGTSYTFSLTAAERTTLRNACATANSMGVSFYVKTVIGSYIDYSPLAKTLTIVNATPTITASAKDVGSVSTTLTGDANKMIKGYNSIVASMTATGLKGATIKSYKITNGGSTVNAASGEFPYTSNNSFVFTATDSRGNTASKTITLTMINYFKLTCNMVPRIAVDGTATINVSGNYFNGSFGATPNTLTVQYRYKVAGGSYSAWTTAPATVSGNTYSYPITVNGLDYQKKYTFQTRATDKINTATTAEQTITANPVFDWGETDFQFNVPVKVNVNNETVFKVDYDDTSAYIQSLPAYNRTYALSPNMLITNLGTIGRGTSSSMKYKEDIKDVVNEDLNPTRILDIPVRQYKYNKDNIPVDRNRDDIYIGLIAEEVAEAYPAAAEYNENGELEMWNIKVLFPALLKVVQEQQKEIEALKSAVERSS